MSAGKKKPRPGGFRVGIHPVVPPTSADGPNALCSVYWAATFAL